jgi:hypothetical protein
MKPKLSFLCLLLSASAVSIVPVISQDAVKPATKTEAQLLQEKQQACYLAVESQILRYINPEVSRADRFSRVLRPQPMEYYTHKIFSENAEGMIEFQIIHINRMITTPTQVVVATGTFESKTGALLLKNEQSGESVIAAEHPLLKKKSST